MVINLHFLQLFQYLNQNVRRNEDRRNKIGTLRREKNDLFIFDCCFFSSSISAFERRNPFNLWIAGRYFMFNLHSPSDPKPECFASEMSELSN